ncbi:MAG: helix-turn-helix transcriptional regulator [Marivibrio sp.]|uniref:helix-turn-helix transcriptional regulator n=1 Tax=Marivibrio sp. TaxID=2039719 RepID=UPI0032EDC756
MTARPPHGANQLIEIVGEKLAIEMLRRYGGGRLYVPRKAAGSDLAREVGLAAAEKLSRAFGGDEITVPLWKRGVYAYYRDREGLSQEAAARKAGIARRTAQNWESGAAASLSDKLQPDLFS